MVSTRPFISKPSSPFNNPLLTVPREPITIIITTIIISWNESWINSFFNCDIVGREFKLKSRYYVHFRTDILGKGTNSQGFIYLTSDLARSDTRSFLCGWTHTKIEAHAWILLEMLNPLINLRWEVPVV